MAEPTRRKSGLGPSIAPAEPKDLLPTRASLLSRLKNRADQTSWQEFFDTYWRLIYSVARKAGLSDADAQDILQETIISVAKHIEGFRYDPKVCSFKTWMLNLTRWRIASQLAKHRREASIRLPPRESQGETATVERVADPAGFDLTAVWDEEWEKNLFAAALERVKRQVHPEQLQIFDLHCVERWPVKKVMEVLGVSAMRVYLAKHRVGRLLKNEIKKLQRSSIC